MSGDPAMIANQKGWTGDNFGWYRDQNGQVVARSIGGKMVVFDGEQQQQTTPAQTDMGNPAITAGQKPAERARTMGLQSNGKGGYMDDSGQVVARTVNGELVFYDDKGGAVSDGAGGQHLTQSSPSWVDPDSGLILVPPAQPETPEEKASTPDPIPATPPMGFDLFITQKHKGAKAAAQAQRAADGDIASQEQEVQQAYMEMGADTLQMKFQALIEKGQGTGRKRSEYIANALTDSMNQNVERYKEYFATIDPELHDDLQQLIIKQALGQAKKDFYTEFVEKSHDQAIENGDTEAHERFNKLNTSDHDTAQQEIDSMMDDALGIKEIKSGKFEKLTGGLYTDYELKEVDNPGATLMGGGLDGEELWELKKEADNTAREYGLKNPKQIITVEWGVAEDARGVDPRKVALDALSAWRTEVLPDLPVGAILHNIPAEDERLGAGNKRERIYRLAGFGGDSEKYKGMYGIVVVGEDGKKKLVPIDMEKTGNQQEMPEQIIYDLILDVEELKEETINNIYEALMG
ncbi:MAG: hypothetical protein EB165_06710 [Euryarchaeota archaeon]|nr:hypothetical protein [Euryarchaeota archaeon]